MVIERNTNDTPSRGWFQKFACYYGITHAKLPIQVRRHLIKIMMNSWTGSCLNKEFNCGIFIALTPKSRFKPSPLMRARFDMSSYTWLCEKCYLMRYPQLSLKERNRQLKGWTSELPAPLPPPIQSAKKYFDKTGKRYHHATRRKPEIFDKSKANYSLTREYEGVWIKYRCPQPGCDFYLCARAFQGWPEHTCTTTKCLTDGE